MGDLAWLAVGALETHPTIAPRVAFKITISYTPCIALNVSVMNETKQIMNKMV